MGPNSGGLPAPEPVEAPDPRVRFHDALQLASGNRFLHSGPLWAKRAVIVIYH